MRQRITCRTISGGILVTNRLRVLLVLTFLFLISAGAFAQTRPEQTASRAAKIKPRADNHQHVFSPALVEFSKGSIPVIAAAEVIKLLDEAGIERAVLLSSGYSYGRPGREPQDEYARVKAENDWNGIQAALYPKRLRAFCGFNPLKDYALEEMVRCARNPNLRRGIKMHFGNSDVQLENPEHIEKLKKVFREANARRMAIVVHMRASISKNRPYGPEQARAFLEQLLPLATNIPVQVAHLSASGPGFEDPKAHTVLEVLAEAVEKRDPRTRNLWFDVTTITAGANSAATSALIVKRIRQIGVKRILYGTDAAVGGNPKPSDAWEMFCQLALSDDELKRIARNVAPYLR